VRVYLPATLPLLESWLAAGQAPPGTGCAVTPGLREWYREGDQDELDYAAQTAAARAALALLADDPGAPRRRVVIAVDVADLDVAVGAELRASTVAVAVPVPVSAWVASFVDDDDSQAVVSAAATALPAADLGDDDAQFAVDEAEATELSWYAVQELTDLFR
jgi:hypothetical protein